MNETEELLDRAEVRDGQAIVTYSRTEAALAELRKKYAGAKYDLTTTAGDRAARLARLELKTLRTDLEKKRKELKTPAVEFGRKIDSEAVRITSEIEALEAPIDQQIKADEQRREDERRAREEAEAARRKVHTDAIAKLAGYVTLATDLSSERIAAGIAKLQGMDLTGFEEFQTEAVETRDRTVAALQVLQLKAKAREDAQAQMDAQRAEQARVAAEQAERQRILDAEAARLDAAREAIERQQAEQRRVDAERERALAEEQARADRDAQEKFNREQREAAERQRQEAAARVVTVAAPMPPGHAVTAAFIAQPPLWNGPRNPDGSPAPIESASLGASPTVVAIGRASAAPATPPTLRLGQINERIAPLSIDAAGLTRLGFPPAATDKNAKLFHEADFPRIVDAMASHLHNVQVQQQAAA
jgi:hypothetical protein